VVTLGIKRLVAHWTLDAADFVGGLYLDSSGEGHHAEPNVLRQRFLYGGVDREETDQALDTKGLCPSVADSERMGRGGYTADGRYRSG
jgi:hypothetical protein